MLKQSSHTTINHHQRASLYMLCVLLIVGMIMILLPACQHEPLAPIDPDPIDTMGVDTIDEDTLGTPCDPDVVYFDRDLLPILKSNCAKSGCHDAISQQDDIILDSYENVMASDIVKPYDLNSSDMYEVITETDPDKRMPEPPNQKLTTAQIALIAKWIQQGAKDLTCDDMAGQCNTTNITYSGFIAPLLTTYCVGCHSGGAPSGNIVLNSHAGVQTVALNGRLIGAITWANGFQQMPRGSGKLSDCNIQKVKAWIDNGAPNN